MKRVLCVFLLPILLLAILSAHAQQPVTSVPVVTTPAGGVFSTTATPTYTGTAPAGSTVTVYVGGLATGATTADASGAWSLEQPTALLQGATSVYATAQSSGQAVSAGSAANSFTVDTQPLWRSSAPRQAPRAARRRSHRFHLQ